MSCCTKGRLSLVEMCHVWPKGRIRDLGTGDLGPGDLGLRPQQG